MIATVAKPAKAVPLGEVAEFIRGITFTPDDKVKVHSAGSVVCMRTANIQADLDEADLIAVPDEFVRRSEQFLREGDLLVSTANSWNLVGKCVWVPRLSYRATAGGFISILRGNVNSIDLRYLFHWFSSEPIQHEARRCGRQTTNISNLDYGRCLSLPIHLPPLAEQKRIAAILDKADALRRKRRELVQIIESIPQSILADIRAGQLRTSRIEEVANVGGGIALSGRRAPLSLRRPYLRVANVFRERLDLTEVKEVGLEENELEKARLQAGDVLVVEGHGNPEEIGRAAVWDGSINDCVHQNHLIRIRCNRDLCNPVYLSAFLNSHVGRRRINGAGKTTSGLNTISISDVRATTIELPPIEEQRRFESLVRQNTSLRSTAREAWDQSNAAYNSLVQRAFRGEL